MITRSLAVCVLYCGCCGECNRFEHSALKSLYNQWHYFDSQITKVVELVFTSFNLAAESFFTSIVATVVILFWEGLH